MKNDQALKRFRKTIEARGLALNEGGKHLKITKNGVQVGVLAKSGEQNALRQAMRDLRRGGYVGDDECRMTF